MKMTIKVNGLRLLPVTGTNYRNQQRKRAAYGDWRIDEDAARAPAG